MRIGSLLGIPFYLDSSWFYILALVTYLNAQELNGKLPSDTNSLLPWLGGLLMALLLFSSVLLHELGHSLVAKQQGIGVKSITLFLFGGVAAIERESKTPGEAFQVAIAGPLVSISLFIIFGFLSDLFSQSSFLNFVALDLARINLVLTIFNLIPGLPLDGGQVLKALVWKISGDRFTGVIWAANSGKFIGWFGISFGLFLLLMTGDVGAVWLSLISYFVLRNANAYNQITKLQKTLLTLSAAEIMAREFRVVDANLTLTQFIEQYILADINKLTNYYAASEGRYRGLIEVQDIQLIERSKWDCFTLAQIAHPLTEIPSVEEKTSLIEVIKKLESISSYRLTVLSPAGAVSGVIDRGDIVKAIASKQKLAIPASEIKRIKEEGTYPPGFDLKAIVKTMNND